MLRKLTKFFYSQKIDLHSDILSLKEIQQTIKSVVQTHEDKFLNELKDGKFNPKSWLRIKHQYIEPNDAVKIIKTIAQQQNIQSNSLIDKAQTTQELVKNDIYNYFIKYFSKKCEKLTFSQIAVVLEQYAYVKRFDQEFFRIMENEIYDRLEDKNEIIKYQDIEKILWAYQYCHYGSAILYGELAKVIKIAQHEINPMKLAYYSYLYSKCPDNQKGGFGIYAVTEKQILQRIKDYNFSDFVKIAKYIFTPNICSNDFQIQIEEQLAEQFPTNKNLKPPELVKLCKSTINYYYKYKDRALQHKIEGACIDLIDKVNDQQFSQIMWCFLKSRKGNAELYKKFSEQLNHRQQLLSFRQLVLLYLNSANNLETFDITKQLNSIIIERIKKQENIKPIYLAYITIASMLSKLQTPVSLSEDHIKQLSIPLKLAILQTLQQSLPHLEQIKLAIQIIKDLQINDLAYEDQVILCYSEKYFYKFCAQTQIQLKPQIHKSLFHMAFYLDTKNEHIHNQLIVLQQQYKNEMRFFFKQDSWIVISWCLLQEHILNKERIIKKELLDEACLGIKELDINAINNVQKYIQSLWMVILIEKLKVKYGVERIQQFIKVNYFAQTTALLNNFKDTQLKNIQTVLDESLTEQCSELMIKYEFKQSYINMFDQDIGMMLPVAYLIKTSQQNLKFGLLILESKDFNIELTEQKNIQEQLGKQDTNILKQINKEIQLQKLIYEQLFDWNIEYIYIEEFENYTQQQQIEYLKNIFALDPSTLEDLDELHQNNRNKRTKSMKFSDKLNQKKQKQQNRYEQVDTHLIELDDSDSI